MRPTLFLLALAAAAAAAPPEVPVAHPVEREVFDHEDAVGRIEASTTVDIRSRVTGYLDKVAFKEGSAVKKGDLLFQVDDRLQRAELAKAQAGVARVEAGLKRAELDHARLLKLSQAGAV